MSIATGEPRGRVTIIRRNSYDDKISSIEVIERAEVRALNAPVSREGEHTINVRSTWSSGTGRTIQVVSPSLQDCREIRDAVFDSIVLEDVDVIWSGRYNEPLTRVPDAPGGK